MNTDERAALKAELRLEAENDREEFEAAFWSELREELEAEEMQRFEEEELPGIVEEYEVVVMRQFEEEELPGLVEESIACVREEQAQVLESQWRVYISDSE